LDALAKRKDAARIAGRTTRRANLIGQLQWVSWTNAV